MKLLDFHKIFKFDDMRRWKRVHSTARTVSSCVSNADQDSLYRKTMYEFQDSWIRRIPADEWWNIVVTVKRPHNITRVVQPFSPVTHTNVKKSMQKCDIRHNSFNSVMTSPSNWVRDYKNYYIIYFITYYIIYFIMLYLYYKWYLSKSVEEWLRQSFSTSSLFERILTREYLHLLMLYMECFTELRYIYLRSVIKTGIQTFQHWLWGQVQL